MKDDRTKVIFRKFKTGGDVIAIFPEIQDGYGTVLSYQHIGQHGACCINFSSFTVPANGTEIRPLLKELKSIGYTDLKIVKRMTPKMRANSLRTV